MTTMATGTDAPEETVSAAAPLAVRGIAALRDGLRALSHSRIGMVGLVVVLFWIIVAILAPLLAPYSPYAVHPLQSNQAPSTQYLLGTDFYGRDILSRIIMGSRSVLVIAPLATLIGLVLGMVIGLSAGYLGGIYDELVMRVMDGFMAFPTLIIMLLLISVVPPSTLVVTLIVGINFAPYSGRVVRSAVLAARDQEFVAAAKLRGEPAVAIMVREILPTCLRPIVVEGTTRVGYAIFAEAGLSFLGLGVPPPTPDWGVMINEAQSTMLIAPWAAIFPAAAIASLVVGVNLLADGIKQVTV